MHASAANSPPSPRLEWVLVVVLGANLAWSTLALGGYRPESRVVTWGLTGLLLVVHLLASAASARPLPAPAPARWTLGPFLLYAAVNVIFVSPVPWLGWLDGMHWANLAVTFWVVRRGVRSLAPRRALFFVLIGLGLAGVVLGCHQRFVEPGWLMFGRQQADQFVGRASGSFGIPNSFAGFLILLLPATGALACRGTAVTRVWWVWVTAVFAFGLFLTLSRGAWLSLGLALVAWPLAVPGQTWRRRLAFAAGALAVVFMLGAALHTFSPEARARLDRLRVDAGELSRPVLWRGAWELWKSAPLTGTGAGSFNVLFEAHRPAGFVDEPEWAHNEYLNVLSDYGLVGLGLLVFAVVRALPSRRQRNLARVSAATSLRDAPAPRRAIGIGLLAFALQMAFEFHLKLPALGLALSVVAALALGPLEDDRTAGRDARRGRGRAGWIAMAIGVVAVLVLVLRGQLAEAACRGARGSLDAVSRHRDGPTIEAAGTLRRAEAGARRAADLWPRHAGAWSEVAAALHFQAYVEPARRSELARPAEAAARRALEISAVVPEFWLRLGVSLDLQGRWTEAGTTYEKALQLAPQSAIGWYYYADHLSRATETREAALRAIATCLSLDPGNAAAEALRAKLSPSR